jgi:hypothetical protein
VKQKVLTEHFHIEVPQDVMVALCTMRRKVNRMKHEPGVEFVPAEYEAGITAINQFWEFVLENEQTSGSGGL